MKQFLLAFLFAPLSFFAQDQKIASNQKNVPGPESTSGLSSVSAQKGVTVSNKKNEPAAPNEVINTNTVGTVSNKKNNAEELGPKK